MGRRRNKRRRQQRQGNEQNVSGNVQPITLRPPVEEEALVEDGPTGREPERLSDDKCDQIFRDFNERIQKESEQYDKTVIAIASLGLGFAVKLYSESPEATITRLFWIASVTMSCFAFAIVGAMLSFRLTITASHRFLDAIDQYQTGEEDQINPPSRLAWWADFCNWLNFGSIVLGVGLLVWWAVSMKGVTPMSAKSKCNTTITSIPREGIPDKYTAGPPRVSLPVQPKSATTLPKASESKEGKDGEQN